MKKIFLLLFLISSLTVFSQEDAWVYFNDKPDSANYFSNPLTMLTQRALDRRTNQGIALDSKDVPIYQPYINQIIASTGIIVKAKSKWFNCVHVRGTQTDIDALKLLSSVLRVEYANHSLNSAKKIAPQPKLKPVNKVLKTAINYNYGTSSNQIQMLNGHLLHQLNYTGFGKIIAILDAGFLGVDIAQPFQRIRDNNQILGGYNYVTKSSNFYTGVQHGASVLSLIGGFTDGQLIGTAPDAQYYLFITEDDASENPVEESNWVEAAEAADSLGVDIITTSLGYTTFDNPNYNYTYNDMNGSTTFVSRGVDAAFSRGMVCVVSAGNEGNEPWHYISAPADAVNALTIGSVDASRNYATSSSQGPTFDGRIKPDVMAQGQNPYVSDATGNINNSGSGTSYSGPIIAGMVACLWQALPGKTNQDIKQLITKSADRFLTPNNQYGYGIPDFSLALTNGKSVEEYFKKEFKIYPNPTNNFVSLTLPKDFGVKTLVIYNVLGQKVVEEKISNELPTISLISLKSGMYFYTIELNNFSKIGKIIKQ